MSLTQARHSLVLGGFDLTASSSAPWSVELVAANQSWGAPVTVSTVVRNLFGPGSSVLREDDDNRTVTFGIIISAADSGSLADGEAAFRAELGKRNTLTWVPYDGIAPPTVFEVLDSDFVLAPQVDGLDADLAELTLGRRGYTVTLTCEPHSRSEALTTTPALTTGSPTTNTINSGATTTNWVSGSGSFPVTGSGGNIGVAGPNGARLMRYTPGSAIDCSVMRYITITLLTPFSAHGNVYASFGTSTSPAAKLYETQTNTGSGTKQFVTVYLAPTTSVSQITVWADYDDGSTSRMQRVSITQSNQPPAGSSTNRELARTLEVDGSAPTAGSIQVTGATGLGSLLVSTYPQWDGYSPSLRPTLLSSAASPTSDTATYSGFRNSILTTATVFELVASAVPSGTHLMLPYLRASVAGSVLIGWSAQVFIAGVASGVATTAQATVTLAANTWTLGAPVEMQLPPVRVPMESMATVRLSLLGQVSSGTLEFDDAWAFWRRDITGKQVGALTWVEAGSAKTVYIDSATTDVPSPTVYLADVDRTSAYFPGLDGSGNSLLRSWDRHRFEPGSMGVFTASACANVSTSFSHYDRWHTHAAR